MRTGGVGEAGAERDGGGQRIPRGELDDGGRLIIPIGTRGQQTLLRVTRVGDELRREELLPVSFVPFVEGTET